ncbi:MAG TPA: sulfotransferase domain-containing protein [Mycobacteriales bacterium]|nr:sulfotransferase domain-containing protein [Mycobacteriales bacterium]
MVGVGTLKAAVKEQPRLQELARATARTTGRLTASARMTPSFLIVGAQRCGTTSMYKTLSQHPMVLPAVLHKGAHYFDTGYGHGPAWYRGHFPLHVTARRAAPAPDRLPITGESSPYYMFHPLAGQRIAADLPGVKLVVLLRDPVERAYSAHTHETARGFETEPFERALELEPVRLAGEEARLVADPAYQSHSHQHHAYVTRGRYADQLRRLEALFGRDRLHVVDSQRFFTDPEPVFADVVDFLGVGAAGGIAYEKHNARPRAPMPDSVRARLEDQLADSDSELETWLGAPPSWRS